MEFAKQSSDLLSGNIIIRRLLSTESLQMEALWCSSFKTIEPDLWRPCYECCSEKEQNCILKRHFQQQWDSWQSLPKLLKGIADFNYHLSRHRNWLIFASGERRRENSGPFFSFSGRCLKNAFNVPSSAKVHLLYSKEFISRFVLRFNSGLFISSIKQVKGVIMFCLGGNYKY